VNLKVVNKMNNPQNEDLVDKVIHQRMELLNGTDDDSAVDDVNTAPRKVGATDMDYEESVDEEAHCTTNQPTACDRPGDVPKVLSKARIVSDYGAYQATIFEDIFNNLCLPAMKVFSLLNEDVHNAFEAMNVNDAMEWRKLM